MFLISQLFETATSEAPEHKEKEKKEKEKEKKEKEKQQQNLKSDVLNICC